MSTTKNGHILLYCQFNKMIKGLGTSFQSEALSQKHFRNVCRTAHQYLTKYHFDSNQASKEINISVTMPMIMSQILKAVDFTKKNKNPGISRTKHYFFFR